MAELSDRTSAAIAHVDAISSGGPLDRGQRITLNFHPDRDAGGLLTIERLLLGGVYRSQFETGTSNGGLTAHVGGARWLWEQRLFGGVYDDAPVQQRPKYGALNHRDRPLGGAPRFGSSYLRLAGHMLDRATFCFPDSAMNPVNFGTARHCELIEMATQFDATGREPDSEPDGGDLLDGYVEAHVHGVIDLATDVEAVVLDPCYRGTDVEQAARRLPCALEWHEGRVLTVEQLAQHAYYRDPEAQDVGRAIARDGFLDAGIIGVAARSGRYDPQAVKQVWHLTARFGRPRADVWR